MHDFNLKKTLAFLSEHFTLLLFIPLLMGGITQVANLYCISPIYIRFFSPTQAIADGVFILTYLVLSFIAFLLISTSDVFRKLEEFFPETDSNGATSNTFTFWFGVVCIALLLVLIRLFVALFSVDNSERIIGIYIIFIGIVSFLLSLFLGALFFSMRFKDAIIDVENEGDEYFWIPYISVPILTSMILLSFLSYNSCKTGSFSELTIRYAHPTLDSKIIYYNDKYIFMENYCDGFKSEIKILKFEYLLDPKIEK